MVTPVFGEVYLPLYDALMMIMMIRMMMMMRAFRKNPAAQGDPQNKLHCLTLQSLRKTQQDCDHFLGALGPSLSLPVFMTRPVNVEPVLITTYT